MSASQRAATLPDSAVCARHGDRPATFLCARCGDFACDACAHRVHPTAQPLCAGCWGQREHAAAELERSGKGWRLWTMAGIGLIFLVWLAYLAAILAGI